MCTRRNRTNCVACGFWYLLQTEVMALAAAYRAVVALFPIEEKAPPQILPESEAIAAVVPMTRGVPMTTSTAWGI